MGAPNVSRGGRLGIVTLKSSLLNNHEHEGGQFDDLLSKVTFTSKTLFGQLQNCQS